MKRKWIKQGSKRNCGQIAVAVITGESLEKVSYVIGHDHGTKTKELAKALRFFGYDCPDRLQRLKERPKLAIAKLSTYGKSSWHWVVIDGDKIYDGVNGTESGTVNWTWSNCKRITSYLPIKKRN
jgi:hypothetical protein